MEKEKKQGITYNAISNGMLLREQPFYRTGMSGDEAEKELEYLNQNIKEFYEGKYSPLWKQRWFS